MKGLVLTAMPAADTDALGTALALLVIIFLGYICLLVEKILKIWRASLTRMKVIFFFKMVNLLVQTYIFKRSEQRLRKLRKDGRELRRQMLAMSSRQ